VISTKDIQAVYDKTNSALTVQVKTASTAVAVSKLAGRLYLSDSGWLLLHVPNALIDALFTALDEPGIQKPISENGKLRAHVSVMSKDEVDQLGADNITERGRVFHYQLGPVKSVEPKTWENVSKVWYVTVESNELKQLRKSYGLSALPHGDWDFHITIAVRKKKVLRSGAENKLDPIP